MAMYTNLRVRCRLTPAALPLVQRVTKEGYSWQAAAREPGYEYLAEFAADRCSIFIPHNTSRGQRVVCSASDRLWSFSCRVKNYSGVIEKFLLVLPPMIEEVYECKTRYELADVPTDHYLRNGCITDIDLHGTGGEWDWEMDDDESEDDNT